MRAGSLPRPIWVLLGFLGTCLVTVDAFASSWLPRGVLRRLTAYAPWLRTPVGMQTAHWAALAGSLALFAAWIALRPRPGTPRRVGPLATAALWITPLLVAPPVMTADPFAYAAQGWLLLTGRDPYQVAMGVPGPFAAGVYIAWRPTTAVYPPFALRAQEFIVWLTGTHQWWSVIGMRALALAGLAVMGAAAVGLARDRGISRDVALWAVVANPLVIVQLIGGAHNDTLMTGLIMAALWLASRRHGLWTASALLGVAALCKQPAVFAGLGVVLLATPEAWRTWPIGWGRLAWRAVAAGAVAAAVFVAGSLASGLGFGWLGKSAGSPSLVINHSPLSWVAQAALLGGVSQPTVDLALKATSGLLLVTAFAVIIWRTALRSPVLMTGALLLAFGVFGTAIQPWYVLWGMPILLVSELAPRWRKGLYATVLLLLISGVLQGIPSPVVGVPIAAAAAYAWWRWYPLED